YAYDGSGNVTQVGQGYYLYDPVSRLTTAEVETNPVNNSNPSLDTFSYQGTTYDAFGNIQGFSSNSTPTDPSTNHLTGGSYDASGNLRAWNGASTYDYDELNKLKHYVNGAQEWFYMYDADDERVWSFEPPLSPNPRFDRWTLRGLDGKVKRHFELYGYNWGNAWTGNNQFFDYIYRDGLLLWIRHSWGAYRISVDHLGTPRLAGNVYGSPFWYKVYYPFGEEVLPAGATSQDSERTRFTGHERDLASLTSTYPNSPQADDLDYMHARHYSFLTGRFLSIDPGLSDETAPQELNRYAYVNNSPLKLIDPTGLDAEGTVPDYGVGEGITVFSGVANFNAADTLAFASFQFNSFFNGLEFQQLASQFQLLFNLMNPYLRSRPSEDDNCPPFTGTLQAPCQLQLKIGMMVPPEFGEVEGEFKIAGYTKHGINSAINHDGLGVTPKAILDTLKNPLKVVKRPAGDTKVIGKNAIVILNEAWKVVSTWARNSASWRIF
ncbi:MAG TPA: RHS repeat-associated core domain-containing protein, partial [Thermoanaerobaculia bacterium]|nr:RHS repeat-associated core domain-containing protein [Thermoanaerobaculia bacterium]